MHADPAEMALKREREARDRFAQSRPSSRILLRDAYDHQSNGRWNIKRVGGYWVSMYLDDWFNTVVHLPFMRLLAVLAIFYIFLVSVFALAYLSFADQCGMDFSDGIEAYYFSIETMATIGYGTSDYFFGHCWEPLVIINLQVTASLVVESLYFGIIFHRLTRGRKRTNTVLFSDKAVVRKVADAYYLIFQVCEMRRHHLLDARVRLFAIKHERDKDGGVAYYQAHRMALKRPNDAAGGMLLMALPQLVVHKLDWHSPLVPTTTWMSASGPRHWPGCYGATNTEIASPPVAFRSQQSSAPAQGPAGTSPPTGAGGTGMMTTKVPMPPRHVRGASVTSSQQQVSAYFTPYHPAGSTENDAEGDSTEEREEEERLPPRKRKHASSSALDKSISVAIDRAEVMSSPEPSPRGSSSQFIDEDIPGKMSNDEDANNRYRRHVDHDADLLKRNMEAYCRDREIEVVAIVEGNDEYTSRLVQARHSYTVSDLSWWRNFAPCVFRQSQGDCVVNFSQFHATVRTNNNNYHHNANSNASAAAGGH